jgi:hypothetical protein
MVLFSAGFPTGVRGMFCRYLNPTLRTGFPLPFRAGHKATGRLHCYICNFLRVAQATLLCKSRIALFLAPFRDFLRISTTSRSCNQPACGKSPQSVKKPLHPPHISPKRSSDQSRWCRVLKPRLLRLQVGLNQARATPKFGSPFTLRVTHSKPQSSAV